MRRCRNPRRYPRLDIEVPIRVIAVQQDFSQNRESYDLPFPPIRFFDQEKEAWLNKKVIEYRKSIDLVVQHYGENVKPPFELISEKLVFIEDILHSFADAENPLETSNSQQIKAKFNAFMKPINTQVLGATKTSEILSALDEKATAFISMLFCVLHSSDQFYFHIEYLPDEFPIDAIIKKLSKAQGVLAVAFANLYDYLNELIAIHMHINDIMDYDRLKKLGQKVNLSAGGVRMKVPHRLNEFEKVKVDLIASIKPCQILQDLNKNIMSSIRREDDSYFLRLDGSVVRERFDAQMGMWEVAINFDMLNTYEFNLISALIAQKDFDAIPIKSKKADISQVN